MLDERPAETLEELPEPIEETDAPEVVLDDIGPVARPLAVAALAAGAAGFMAGGIFGEWMARGIGVFGALFGVLWSWVAMRSRRPTLVQASLLPAAFVLGVLSLVPTTDGPGRVFSLMGDAISSGRLLRPPVPFDPGWRPILLLLLSVLGFVAGTVSAAQKRPQLALLAALPLLGLTAISQPAEGEFIGGIGGFLPILVALGVLFGGDGRVSELGSSFELKRALRSAPMLVGGLVLVLVLGKSDFLFPKPVYNPADKPQKPKSIPLGKVRDRVLFEIDGALTGPWKNGVLDVYDGKGWRLPPYDTKRLKSLRGDGVLDQSRVGDTTVTFTIRDLGTSSVLPGLADPTRVVMKRKDVVYDARTGALRMRTGRVPVDLTYTMSAPKYPTDAQLKDASPARRVSSDLTYIPKAPPVVQQLLDAAPQAPWARLDYLRSKLNAVVIAVGAGEPSKDVPPSKVADLLNGSHEGSPFEIVAAEAMLARWAGFPARIGYGFDGINEEDGKKTVRPKNGSNWLEVDFDGYGWIPLIGQPPKAKASLDPDDNTKYDPSILPSTDVAVELYVPVEVKGLKLLYQKIRALIAVVFPYALAVLLVYLLLPATRRLLRRRKRRQWAQEKGLRYEVAVEYCELRDAATDLNVGHPSDTPLEFLARVAIDDEHTELAWLVTRVMYGDLAFEVTDEHVEDAREMSASLRRRMARVQPFQSRALAFLSRASLNQPYTLEVPNVRVLRRRRRTSTTPRKKRTPRTMLRRRVR